MLGIILAEIGFKRNGSGPMGQEFYYMNLKNGVDKIVLKVTVLNGFCYPLEIKCKGNTIELWNVNSPEKIARFISAVERDDI